VLPLLGLQLVSFYGNENGSSLLFTEYKEIHICFCINSLINICQWAFASTCLCGLELEEPLPSLRKKLLRTFMAKEEQSLQGTVTYVVKNVGISV